MEYIVQFVILFFVFFFVMFVTVMVTSKHSHSLHEAWFGFLPNFEYPHIILRCSTCGKFDSITMIKDNSLRRNRVNIPQSEYFVFSSDESIYDVSYTNAGEYFVRYVETVNDNKFVKDIKLARL